MALTYENTLHRLQEERAEWVKKNFPHSGVKEHALGVAEEVGELCHAVGKLAPGLGDGGSIRGDKDSLLAEAADAIGDTVVFLAGVATDLGLALDVCVSDAWEEVKARDWNANKEDGNAERREL